MTEVASYRLFDVRRLYKKRLSPSLMRCEQVSQVKMDGPDQRIQYFYQQRGSFG